ncbi:NPC2 [Mytilus edulis]|uniref:NPC2 n=1 Tax=Mytilus edulis TaxID=6550 RepID=A0A8S3U304_MYTED|nr:NPC2 [Mytilus edulis]
MIKLTIFSCVLVAASAIVIHNYRDCGSRDGLVKSIDISPCTAEPCKLKRGTNVTVAITFTSKVDTTSVTTSVHGILGFIPIPFVGIPKDACANNNVDHCPIVNGETIVYSNQIYVNPVYPLLRVTVEFEVKDEHHDMRLIFNSNTARMDPRTLKIKVDFVSPASSATLDAEIFGILAGIPIKFNMPNPNGCNDCGITCPIKQNMEYVYSSEFFVMKSYPNIQLVVQWDLRGANKDFLFCFEFPMTIVD